MQKPQITGSQILRPIQDSFAGGEYSQDMYSRVSLEKYKIGLKTCRNFLIHPTGNASNRAGFRYIASTKKSASFTPVYMRRFIFSTTQAYVLEFGDFYIRFYLNRSQIQMVGAAGWLTSTGYVIGNFVTQSGIQYYCIVNHTSGIFATDLAAGKWVAQNIYEIPSPYAISDVPNLRFEQSADTLYIWHMNYQQMILQRFSDNDWAMSINFSPDGPFRLENIDEGNTLTPSALTGSITLASAKSTFFPSHVGALWQLTNYIQGQTYSGSLTGTGVAAGIPCFTTWRITTHGTWTGQFNVEKSLDGGSTWTVIRSFSSSNDFNVDTFGTEDPTVDTIPFKVRINVTSFSSGTLNVDLTCDAFYQNGIVQITEYSNSQLVSATVLQAIGSTTPTWTWSEGAWSDYRGYPALGRFYQDRLCQSSSPSDVDNNWFSRASNYKSYGVFNPIQDSDAISIPLPSRQLNSINGLIAFQQLIAFTSGGSWTIQATTGNTLTPETAFQQPEEYYGSAGIIEPIVIGREVIYAEKHKRIVRNISFNLYYNGYLGSEVSVLARHLFQDNDILEMQFASYPDNIVYFLRDDGVIVGLTYLKEQEVVAFHHHDTLGTILSICVIPGESYDELWVSVQRKNGVFVEVLEQRLTEDVRQSFFVDSGVTYDNPLNITGTTQTNPVVVTSPNHGFTNGALVDVDNVIGMTQINGNRYKLAGVTTNTFQLENYGDGTPIDGTGYGSYLSGGVVRLCETTFVGLDHLNGQSAAILGDGFVYDQIVVGPVTGGIGFVLPEPASIVQTGLQYLSDLETLNVEIPQANGSMQGRLVQIPNIVFRFVNSRGGWVGPAEFDEQGNNYLKEGFFPTRQTLNAPPLFTGDMRQEIAGNFEQGGRVFYRQYDPLPVTIGALIYEINLGGIQPD